jgi:hypothetical protein
MALAHGRRKRLRGALPEWGSKRHDELRFCVN